MKHVKALSLAAIVVAMMAVVGVASASAAQFHTSASNPSIKGTQEGSHKFTVQGSSVTCTTAEFTGTGVGTTATTQEVHPHYTGCTAFGFIGATINSTGCQYKFDADNTTVVELKSCTSANGIEIDVGAEGGFTHCHVNVANQAGINGNAYDNDETAPIHEFMKVTTNATNISFSVTASTGFCPLSIGTGTNGKYVGTTKVVANNGASTIWIE